jgi:hypothetical protein
MIDYESEPSVKAIAVGGNRLSRGLTLEGLLISYFFRSSAMYDTLMQMGRWFGFKEGYEDLTRIFMTSDLSSWFSDLALVEYELRQDIRMYEARNVTPLELGTRILKHPSMLVTSRLKQRYARSIVIEQSYSSQVLQTYRFPFTRRDDLHNLLEINIDATRLFLSTLGISEWEDQFPIWQNVTQNQIIPFLLHYSIDPIAYNISMPLVIEYIRRQNGYGELINWTVAIRGREKMDPKLGGMDLGIGHTIPMISRNRLASDTESLGIITNPGDELIGLTPEQRELVKEKQQNSNYSIAINPAARNIRPPTDGLLLIYPVSRFSGYEAKPRKTRRPIYDEPDNPLCMDVICIALSFPRTENDSGIRGEYTIGTVDWRPV